MAREKFAWKAKVKEGMLAEYQRRHAEIWPEMVAVLKEAGIVNYSIWNTGDELFVVDKWNVYMQDVMVMIMDPVTGAQPRMQQVFNLD